MFLGGLWITGSLTYFLKKCIRQGPSTRIPHKTCQGKTGSSMLQIRDQLEVGSKGLFSQCKEITEDVSPSSHCPVLPIIFIRDMRKNVSRGIAKTADDTELPRKVIAIK